MKHMAKEFEAFRSKVLSEKAGRAQVTDMKIAFFAGALSVITRLMENFEDGKEPTENDEQLMSDVFNELSEYLMNPFKETKQ